MISPHGYSFQCVATSQSISRVHLACDGIDANLPGLSRLRCIQIESGANLQDGRQSTHGARLAGRQLMMGGNTLGTLEGHAERAE